MQKPLNELTEDERASYLYRALLRAGHKEQLRLEAEEESRRGVGASIPASFDTEAGI